MYDYKFDWNKSLSVGIDIIDAQHKVFFSIGRKMEQILMTEGADINERYLIELICELREYVTYHFYEEEKFIAKIHPEQLGHHHEAHEEFEKLVNGIDIKRVVEEPYVYLKMIKEEMQKWLFLHIMSEDKVALKK